MDKGQRTIGIVAIAMLSVAAIVSVAGPADPAGLETRQAETPADATAAAVGRP